MLPRSQIVFHSHRLARGKIVVTIQLTPEIRLFCVEKCSFTPVNSNFCLELTNFRGNLNSYRLVSYYAE